MRPHVRRRRAQRAYVTIPNSVLGVITACMQTHTPGRSEERGHRGHRGHRGTAGSPRSQRSPGYSGVTEVTEVTRVTVEQRCRAYEGLPGDYIAPLAAGYNRVFDAFRLNCQRRVIVPNK